MNARRLFACLSVSVLFIAVASPALALTLANRVFVSARSGNNANACDNIATPCQTFAGAVVQLNPGGEAIVLDSGGYGPVTITQSLTIEAPPGVLAFIHPPSGSAITVNAGVSGVVVLRGLVLNGGAGSGIVVITAGTVHIESCVISGFSGDGITVSAGKTFVKDTISRQNLSGAQFVGGRASIENCRFEGNIQGGVFVADADVTVRESVSAGNGGEGFEAFATGAENTILNLYQCMSTNNGLSGLMVENAGSGFAIARVANSSINENIHFGLENAGAFGSGSSTLVSLGNNFAEGNISGAIAGAITAASPH